MASKAKSSYRQKPRHQPADGYRPGQANRRVGVAQRTIIYELMKWLTSVKKLTTITAVAHAIPSSERPGKSVDRSTIDHFFRCRAGLPERMIPVWTERLCTTDQERTALRALLALANTHEAVLDLFDWGDAVIALSRQLCGHPGEYRRHVVSGAFIRCFNAAADDGDQAGPA